MRVVRANLLTVYSFYLLKWYLNTFEDDAQLHWVRILTKMAKLKKPKLKYISLT